MEQERAASHSPVPTLATDAATVELSTPEALTPIRRHGLARAALQYLTVRDLIRCLTSLEPELLRGLPPAQVEAESQTLLGVRELMTTEWCEVWAWRAETCAPVSLDAPALTLAEHGREIKLEVRPREDRPAAPRKRRRRSDARTAQPMPRALETPEGPAVPVAEQPEVPMISPDEAPTIATEATERSSQKIPRDMAQSHGYVRKADWLRAQFLPEVEILDFRGLFVGNKGLWIVEETRKGRTGPVDPAQIADLLLRGNGYRRSGNHVKALMCYQELVELDPNNADFRFLLETTYQAIAAGGNHA